MPMPGLRLGFMASRGPHGNAGRQRLACMFTRPLYTLLRASVQVSRGDRIGVRKPCESRAKKWPLEGMNGNFTRIENAVR